MDRYAGTCEPLMAVNVSSVVEWLQEIPLAAWPQQDRLSPDYPYPAMVSDLRWRGFGEVVAGLTDWIMGRFPGMSVDHRMLSIVVPGQRIAEHDDVQDETWRVRVHVPLITNPESVMWFPPDPRKLHMEVGQAYLVNTEVLHALENLGTAARVHYFFDLKERS